MRMICADAASLEFVSVGVSLGVELDGVCCGVAGSFGDEAEHTMRSP
jgi:hypothetical protein